MAAARMVVTSAATCVALLLFLGNVDTKQNYVHVNLSAKWNSTPLFLEASEFLYHENEDYFWRFVDDVSQRTSEEIKSSSKETSYNLLLEMAAKYLSSLQLNLLKLTLSLRVHSPDVEMYSQMAQEEKKNLFVSQKKLADNCDVFVNIHGEVTCNVNDIDTLIKSAPKRLKAVTYKFDHHYPSPVQADVLVILYAQLGDSSMAEFHKHLKKLAVSKKINYVYRHYIPKPSNEKVYLSGYAVELAIKSTEYKAKDDTKVEDEKAKASEENAIGKELKGFNFKTLSQLYPDLIPQLREFHDYLLDTATELTPMKVWQLQDLSLQAAQKAILTPPKDALSVLQTISQNFPVQARSLVRTSVSSDLRKEILKNQKHFENYHNLSPGECALFLNGISIDVEVYDIYTILDLMRSEAAVMEGLFSLGVREESLNKLVKLDLKNSGDDYVLDFRHPSVMYVNDLEKDVKYRRWPNSIQEMLRPTFPGMLRHIAKNIFHMVFVLDPSKSSSRDLLKIAEAFFVHSAPVRIGLVFAVNTSKEANGYSDSGVAIARAFQYIKIDQDAAAALSFITDLYDKQKDDLTSKFISTEFASRFNDEDLNKVFGDDDDYDDLRKSADDFLGRSGLSDFPQVLLNGIPLKKKYLNADMLEEAVVTEILQGTHEVQRAVYHGELSDSNNILDWLMEKDNVLPRINSRILSAPLMYLDLTESAAKDVFHDADLFGALSNKEMSSQMAKNIFYMSRKDESVNLRPISIWIVTDLETVKGRQLVFTAIKTLRFSSSLRVGIVFNPSDSKAKNAMNKAIHVALTTLSGNMLRNFVTKLVKEENINELNDGTKTLRDLEVSGMDIDQYMATLERQDDTFLKVNHMFVERVLSLPPGSHAIIGNGKVIGPLKDDEVFIQEDFSLFEKHLMQTSAKKIQAHVESANANSDKASDLVMKIASLLSAKTLSESRKDINYHTDGHSVIKIPADPNAPSFEVEVIMDPVSREAQKLIPILITLQSVANMNIKIYMNCKDKLSELPLTNFYRYVLDPELKFSVDGNAISVPYAKFESLPQKSLLTLNMHPPESWLVEAVKSPYDLDNIMLEEASNGVSAEFELEYLLLEGHCHDSSSGQPPRGLQFTLGANNSASLVDTIVMANLGYFQLKAYPGVWLLKLREGRSLDIYEILSHEMTDTPAGAKDLVVAINSFKSKTIRIKVGKKSDKVNEELLKDDEDESMGIWDSISSSFGGGKKEKKEDKDSTLNIFSLASGHLYERFLRIMMLSVLKNTKSKVKFWFLKNYLSPTFKDFIPHMAKEYQFEYELVQYKWPRWLNQQKEKQRIIWGYKILFLDVLFPLNVKKIIFVDADQIVRTDLQELYDLDLGGAPYGYTPFCSSRTEMDGFRFWKSGYWASHLGGRKYHISALYVVDLKKFRRIAAGDRLRGQYQGLSQDPNSLANLDQDLPNNMIHQVAIKSLPQEWLWCETWCSTKELKNAKTIDLCNNPLTKEPKLQAAIRIVPEWKHYDYEIKVLWDKIYNTNTRFQTEYEKPVKDEDKLPSKKDSKKTEL
ncbi:LOW QUALITY PROTEIN: UDP-glucose:glycoprotein glucosyltransferase 1-like [Octopus sinensis]|uniref:LOW QUALITY PROTEIN: UDP-glucose:glycoprotein glucosyltransferase 1-like n=1 Tax=Octopus sinensis TaxID=2607531 RepID=A0A6P7SSF9_9MOLL|nr:LOW QUALITY PROTEIN: UDP-glucose:glycoprotein glucosyltransferase 1-like [Octopus sinensis]